MNWGEWMVSIVDPKGVAGNFFTGTKVDCDIWKSGAENALKALKAKGYTTRMDHIKPEPKPQMTVELGSQGIPIVKVKR